MSLIVKGMSLPRSCSTCRFSYFTVGIKKRCEISGDEVNPLIDHREINCPLTELPTPHGRLIDADEHIKLLKENHCGERCRRNHNCFSCGIDMYIRIVENEPTVIKAEVTF